MPRDENGIQIFAHGEPLPPLPKGLADGLHVTSGFGFKIVSINGSPYWSAATEDDYRTAEGKRRGIDAAAVVLGKSCRQLEPRKCDISGCPGRDEPFCMLLYNPDKEHYYCECTN